MRAEARVEAEGGNNGSSGAPIWLRLGAQQELRSREPFDNTHGSAANRAVPERVVLIGTTRLRRRRNAKKSRVFIEIGEPIIKISR